MTQLFDEEGRAVSVTILRAGPCTVTGLVEEEKRNYKAVQLGFEEVRPKLLARPRLKMMEKLGLPPFRILREFRDPEMELEVGQVLKADIFTAGDTVKVTGISKGKGFQGSIKRHGFHGGRATHGSHFHRAPGSLGATSTPSRVFKGKKLPGHMGARQSTRVNTRVFQVDAEKNLIMVKGAVPGPRTGLIKIEAM